MDKMILALDIGTGLVKAGAFDPTGQRLGYATVPNELSPNRAHPEWTEVDPQLWKTAAIKALGELSQQVPLNEAGVLGLSTLFPALILMDREGQPLRPAILYSDLRATPQIEQAQQSGLAERIFQVTGNRLVSGTSTAASLLWVQEHEPELLARAAVWGHLTSYVGRWLTGGFYIDQPSACQSGLYNAEARAWDIEIAHALGVAERLPQVVSPTELVGQLTEQAAHELGLPAGLPLCLGAGDAATGIIGAGVYGPQENGAGQLTGEVFLATGTTDTVCLVTNRRIKEPRLQSILHPLGQSWIVMASMSYTGGALEWLRRQILRDDAAALFEEAQAAGPGAGGTIFLPFLRGERSPIWDAEVRGVWWGISDAVSRGDLVRAVLEGAGYGLRDCLETLEEVYGFAIDAMTASGGTTQTSVWGQIRADVTQKQFITLAERECSLRGAAWLAGSAARITSAPWPAPAGNERFIPNKEVAQLYGTNFQLFKKLYQQLKGVGAFHGARANA